MMTRRTALALMVFSVLTVWGTSVFANAAHAGDKTAQVFIQGLAEEAVQALTSDGVSRADRVNRFRELLQHNFDVPLIGKWVLGRYWRTATDVEKEEYLRLFEEYVVITYVERFDQYSGEQIKVVKSVADQGTDSVVFSEIHRPTGGTPIRVDWRVRNESDIHKIIDVSVEGISMSQTQRKEFTAVIRSQGGTVSGLLDVLRTKVESLSN